MVRRTRTPAERELEAAEYALLARYWTQRAAGEATSAVAFAHVLEDMRSRNLPDAILQLAARSIEDEQKHALWCRDWAGHFEQKCVQRGRGTSSGAPTCDESPPVAPTQPEPRTRQRLRFRGAALEEEPVLRITLCALTETMGTVLLRRCRPLIRDEALREQNHAHLKDELQHARTGWAALAAFDREARDIVTTWTPRLLQALCGIAANGGEGDQEELVPYGYFPAALQRSVTEEAIFDLIVPGLRELGLWNSSARISLQETSRNAHSH